MFLRHWSAGLFALGVLSFGCGGEANSPGGALPVPQPAGLSIAPDVVRLRSGGTQQFSAQASTTDGRSGPVDQVATWTSSNPAVPISGTGLLTAPTVTSVVPATVTNILASFAG